MSYFVGLLFLLLVRSDGSSVSVTYRVNVALLSGAVRPSARRIRRVVNKKVELQIAVLSGR